MIRNLLHLCLGVLVMTTLAACTVSPSGTPPDDGVVNGDGSSERVFGTVEYYGDPFQATVLTTAEVGKPFDVTVVTYSGSCLEQGETTVETEGLRAEIRPYDYNTTPVTGTCHTATVTFAEAGEAKVVFYGLKEDATVNVSYTPTVTVC